MADSYKDIAHRQWDEIPEPKLLPVGSYLLKALGGRLKDIETTDDEGDTQQATLVNFGYSVVEPMSDVNEVDLEKLGEDYDFSMNKVYATFWINDDGDWGKVKKHLAKHGVNVSGMDVSESLKAVRGAKIAAYLDERSYTNNAGDEVTENSPTNFVEYEA